MKYNTTFRRRFQPWKLPIPFLSLLILLFSFLTSFSVHAQVPELWGMGTSGGEDGIGTIYKINGDGSSFSVLHSFQVHSAGRYPREAMLASNGKLYGTTINGGVGDAGIIYEYDPAASTYTVVHEFTYDDYLNGYNPYAGLAEAPDNKLYGATQYGGYYGLGIIYRYDPATSTFEKVYEFSDWAQGAYTIAGLTLVSDGNFYGMMSNGGANGAGVIYKYDPAGSTYTKLYDFDFSNGAYPVGGSLMEASNGKLYGVTSAGGNTGIGVLFEFDPTTLTFTKKFDFDGTNGNYPNREKLIETSEGKLYGTTQYGGDNGVGVIYQYDFVSDNLTKLFDFQESDGSNPWGGLHLAANGLLYGTTGFGGLWGGGVIFEFAPATDSYLKKYEFNPITASYPLSRFVETPDGLLYATTISGGSGNSGVLFKYEPGNSDISVLVNFNDVEAANPNCSLVQASNGKLYGTTYAGGNGNYGVLFECDPAAQSFEVKYEFDGLNGTAPIGNLIQDNNGKLYGVCSFGGSNSGGTLFEYDPLTNSLTKKYDFDYNSFAYPYAGLLQAPNGKLYGMTPSSGLFNSGVIYEFDPITGVCIKKHDFDWTSGAFPYGALKEASDGKIYGVTVAGGANSYGTVFEFNPYSGQVIKLADFNGTTGYSSLSTLSEAPNGKLYGITGWGSADPYGTIFEFDRLSGILSKKYSFDYATTGGGGLGLSVASNGLLYGANYYGGTNFYGAIFSEDPVNNELAILRSNSYSDGITNYPPTEVEIASDEIVTAGISLPLCSGYGGTVAFTVTQSFNAGNVFTAQLSDGAGSFASPMGIGSLESTESGIIDISIPESMPAGSGYRIRVVSSDPEIIGYSNGSGLIFTVPQLLYVDADGDGYGSEDDSGAITCGGAGYSAVNTDCNDADATVHPGACDLGSGNGNGIDDNCDGNIDDNSGTVIYYLDADFDAYGMGDAIYFCSNPGSGYSTNNLDCNDADWSINPGAYDYYDGNGIDNNCDGCIDSYGSYMYPDVDGDGFGDANATSVLVCGGTSGYSWNNQDCNDADPNINPWAFDYNSNGIDDNCDGCIDGYVQYLYPDADGDGYGDANSYVVLICSGTTGYSYNNLDCNDADANVHPGVLEICGNGIDDDCNGAIDESATYYADSDGDGFGDPANSFYGCSQAGYVNNSNDCNDADASINPWAGDWDSNGIDNNCDGCVDGYFGYWLYPDADGDGFGDAASGGALGCYGPVGTPGYSFNNYDCNDADASVNPGAIEDCFNGIDNNCNGIIDDGLVTTLYLDADGDGYGNSSNSTYACVGTEGYVMSNGDCNDNDASINPGATEICSNGIDDNCDGSTDVVYTYYADADGDAWGDINSTIESCSPPLGYVVNSGDCNDADASINPWAYDWDSNGIDNNCDGCIDGYISWVYTDADGDGYGDNNSSGFQSCNGVGTSWNNWDCNDNDASINPGATELCGNGIDENCDGIDEPITFYADADGDGYGDVNSSVADCNQPVGYVSNSGDCNDADWSINPGAYDYDGNGIDNNCDGCIDGYASWMYPDADGDGFGDANSSAVPLCGSTEGYSWNNQDCNDADPNINPWAPDGDPNGIDDNCDGCIDGYAYWLYPDADGDGYGANVSYTIFCSYPQPGYVFYNGDCNDADPNIYPGANEFDNGVDDNCDGQVDEIQVCSPYIQWELPLGGSSYDVTRSVVETSDGGFVTAGSSYSFDGDVTCNNYYGWIIKTSQSGLLEWQTCISGYPFSIQRTLDNAYIVDGYSVYGDFHLAKIDEDGNVIWENNYGGSNSEGSLSVSASNDGGFVAAGYTSSNDGDVSGNHGGFYDIWVIKVNGSGDLVWQKCLGGSDVDVASSLSPTADGGYLVSGYTYSSDGDVSENHGNQDAWIVKLDGEGNLVWEQTIGSENWETLDGGIETSDGGYALIGYTGSGNFTKFDADRNIQWSIWMPTYASSVVQTTDDGYAVSGGYYSVHHNGSNDMWAAKLKSDGTTQWSKSFGGNNYDDAFSIKQSSDKGYIVAGISYSNDGDVSENKGASDYWIVKLSEDPPSGMQTYYADADGDGYGNSTDSITDISCIAPPGYSYYNTDCNDANASVHPNAFEDCLNGIDDDCNGVIDDGTGDTPFYADVDGDGFGNVNAVVYDCSPPDGYVSNKDDCNDGNAAVHPGADEVCNGIDDNCNNEVDEGYTLYTFFADADGDTYGNHSVYIITCDEVAPDGYVTDDSDCDDENAAVNPGATEIQNGLDDDCDGAVDEGFCSVPTGLFNDAVTTTSAHLHWTEPLNAKRYKIQYMPADGSTPPVNFTVLAPATYVNITGLSTFTLYKWRMKTRCNDGSSSVWTETVGFKTAPFKEGALEKSPSFDVKLYPNPTSGWVNVEVNAGTEQSVVIKFYDIVGKEVYSEEDGLQSGVFSRQIDLRFLSSGTYFLKVIHDGSNEVRKLVMEK